MNNQTIKNQEKKEYKRPPFLIDDALIEAAKKAAFAFEEEERALREYEIKEGKYGKF